MFHQAFPLASCAAACLLSTPALADDAPDAAENRTIIVTARSQSDQAQSQIERTPGGADIVAHDDYADKALVSLRDALAFSPGVYLQPRYGQEIRISVRGSGLSRGFHMRGLTLLQDGAPINLADDNGDFQELEPIFFDHLEVYRGANALRFGSGTLGGAVNGVTPRGSDAKGLYLRGDAGSFETLRGLVSYGGASGVADYWVGLSADTSDGDRDHAKRSSIRFHGNVGLKLSERIATRFYASFNNIDQQLPGALTIADVLTDPKKGNFFGDQQRNLDSIRFQNRTSLDLGAGKLELGAFINQRSLYHPIFQVIDQDSTYTGAFTRFDYEAGPIALTLGGEIRRGSMRARQYINMNGKRDALTFEADLDARTANIYGELRYKATSQLSLIAGAVYGNGWRARHVLFSANPAEDGRLGFDQLSPKFGLLFEPINHVQFYVNYSRSAELPGFGEIFQTTGMPPVNTLISAIRPQTAWTGEIGSRGHLGIASWDISFYRADLRGEMLQYSVSSSIPASTFNADRTRHQGIEAALTLKPTHWLRLRQVYQYSDFQFRNDAVFGGNRLPVIPRHVYRAELRFGTETLHVAPGIEWVPQGPWADYSNTTRTRGYALLGVTAGASLSENIDLFVDARNLTAKKAAGDISATITALPSSAIYYPVERRAVFGGVRMRF